MSFAVYKRGLLDEFRRVRYWVFVAGLAAIAVLWVGVTVWEATWYEADYPNGAPPVGTDEYDEYESASAKHKALEPEITWSIFLRAPVLNGSLAIIFMAVFSSVALISSEWQNRTIFLLLSKPIRRSQFLIAKAAAAWTVTALGIVVAATAGAIMGAIRGQIHAVTANYIGAVVLTCIGVLPIVMFASFFAILFRRQLPALAAGLGALLVLAPLAGAAGFIIAQQDDEFKDRGNYDQLRFYDGNCGFQWIELPEVVQSEAELDQNYDDLIQDLDDIAVCDEELRGDVHRYYESRGVPADRLPGDWTYCQVERWYEGGQDHFATKSGWYSWRHNETTSTPVYACEEALYEDDPWEERDAAYKDKFNTLRVIWSHPLNPKGSLLLFEAMRGYSPTDPEVPNRELQGQGLLELFLGADAAGMDPAPRTAAFGIFQMLFSTGLFGGFAWLLLNRRDVD